MLNQTSCSAFWEQGQMRFWATFRFPIHDASCDLVHCREMQIIMQNCLICHLANIHHGHTSAKVSKVHFAWGRAWFSQVSDAARSDLNTLQWAACSRGRGRHALFKDLVVQCTNIAPGLLLLPISLTWRQHSVWCQGIYVWWLVFDGLCLQHIPCYGGER